jgi:endogenous inhibitor of DNA gyrase (YacG/DUF329 family)
MFQNLHRSMEGHERLSAQCEACGRKAVWSKEQACRIFGPDATPADVRRRLVCTDCGKATARVWI